MTVRLSLLGLVATLNLISCGCASLPETYAPPPQQPIFQAPERVARVLAMSDPDAERHFVQDIALTLEAETWRWTGKRPTIRLYRPSNQNLEYFIDFAIAGATIEKTGPVTVSFFLNDHLLGEGRYTAPGRQRFEAPVPREWIEPNDNLILAAEIDKLWMPAERDGKPLGFILVALGLERK